MGTAMRGDKTEARPEILTFLGVVSLGWSALSLIGVVFAIGAFVVLGMAGWAGGVASGAVTSVIGFLAVVWMFAASILTFLLARAGWLTLHDRPSGIPLHRTWAWISLGLELLNLLMRGGRSSHVWLGLGYAIFVLWATNLPEVRMYWAGIAGRPGLGSQKPRVVDDEAF